MIGGFTIDLLQIIRDIFNNYLDPGLVTWISQVSFCGMIIAGALAIFFTIRDRENSKIKTEDPSLYDTWHQLINTQKQITILQKESTNLKQAIISIETDSLTPVLSNLDRLDKNVEIINQIITNTSFSSLEDNLKVIKEQLIEIRSMIETFDKQIEDHPSQETFSDTFSSYTNFILSLGYNETICYYYEKLILSELKLF